MKCTVINRTNRSIGQGGDLMKEYRTPNESYGRMRITPALPPNAPIVVQCDDEEGAKLPCFIKLLRDTLLIKNNGASEIEITEEGMVIEVISNPSNPELGMFDFHNIHRHLVKAVESRIPQVSSASMVGRPEEDLTNVNKQVRDYFNSSGYVKPRWMTFMVPPPLASIPLTVDDLKKEILDIDKNTMVIYFRALERAPGGNVDTFVIKFVIENGKTVRVASYRNWDGDARRCPVQLLGSDQVKGHVIEGLHRAVTPTLIKLIESGNNIQDGNIRNIEGTIDEEAQTSEAFKTQWSSVEILLFKGTAPEGGPAPEQSCPLLLRVHQRSVLVNYRQGFNLPTLVEPQDPASEELLAVVRATTQTTLMGTTEEFSEGESPLGKIVGTLVTVNLKDRYHLAMPIYLLHPQ